MGISRRTLVAGTVLVLLGATVSPAIARYRFADVTASAGIQDDETRSWGSVWGDYDDDGDPDLFVNRHMYPPRLYVNRGGTYRKYERESVFQPYWVDRHGCAWGEANGDGRPDLYCTQGARQGTSIGLNQLFIQTDDGFVDRAESMGVLDQYGRGRTVNWIDYDLDGDLDLFVGNEFRPPHGNRLFENVGNGFEQTPVGVEEDLHTLSSSWADWDRDGDLDLLVLQRKGGARAYENDGGSFSLVSIPWVTDESWRAATWGDFNGDGWPDLHVLSYTRAMVVRNDSGTFVREHRTSVKHGRASAWFDVENDGDLDLFVVQGKAKNVPARLDANRRDFLLVHRGKSFKRKNNSTYRGPRSGSGDAVGVADHNLDGRVDVFVSNGYGPPGFKGPSVLLENRSDAGRWIRLDLRGDATNPWGIGARIVVESSAVAYERQVWDGFSYRAQSDPSLVHLGIGDSLLAQVRVEWPDGTIDCLTLLADTAFAVRKGLTPCP